MTTSRTTTMSVNDPRGSGSFPEMLHTSSQGTKGAPPKQPRAKDWKPTSIEDQIRHQHYVPTPHEYRPQMPARFEGPTGGRFSEGHVPSALDAPIRTSKGVPGPGAYNVPPPAFVPEGGRMFQRPDAVKGELDREALKANNEPGPGAHNPSDKITKPKIDGIKFEKASKEAKYIKDNIRLASQVPGVGAYDAAAAAEYVKPFIPEGGRALMASKPQTTYFEDAAALTGANPGPAAYTLPGSLDIRPVGQPVFRHESATAAESKRLVDRIIADNSGSTPGPGTYTLPDPHPLMPAPSQKGKSLPHGMPKPFDYNATPDYAGNFAPRPKEMKSLAPVRQKNSGDQIFGRFSASGGQAPGQARERSSAGGDVLDGGKILGRVNDSGDPGDDVWEDEPEGEAEIGGGGASEEIEDKVVWKEGGFETSGGGGSRIMDQSTERDGLSGGGSRPGMPRARSMGALGAQSRHPAVEKAAKSYNRLSGFRKKPTTTFLPMASRRCPIVRTEDTSLAYQRYYVAKSRLEEAGARITQQMEEKVLEPLDLDKLLSDAQNVLELKARMRLRVEGLSREKRMKVLAELPMLFQDAAGSHDNFLEESGAFGEVEGPGVGF